MKKAQALKNPAVQELQSTVNRNLRVIMAIEGYTQQGLADVIQVSRPTVAQKLLGLIPWNLDDLALLADHLHVPVTSLLKDSLDDLLEDNKKGSEVASSEPRYFVMPGFENGIGYLTSMIDGENSGSIHNRIIMSSIHNRQIMSSIHDRTIMSRML